MSLLDWFEPKKLKEEKLPGFVDVQYVYQGECGADPVLLENRTAEEAEKYEQKIGLPSELIAISRDHIQALLEGKMLADIVGGNTLLFIVVEKEQE